MSGEVAHTRDSYGLRPEAQDFPMMVVLSFVYVCNAGCPNCPYNNSDIRSAYRDAMIMSDRVFKAVADECGGYGSTLRISGGGEPMLHPRAVELVTYAKAKGCRVGLITNGSHFPADSLEELIAAGVDALEFSVDAGDPDTYAVVRPRLDWETLVGNVRRARELRERMGARTRIICSAINQQGVDIGAAEAFWAPLVDKVQIRKYLTWGYNEANSADPAPYLPMQERPPCPWLFERLNIDSRGDVTLCGEDIAFAERFANVMQRSVRDIWHGPEFSELRRKHLERRGHEIGICSTCPDWQYRSWNYNYWKVLRDADRQMLDRQGKASTGE